jgi:alkylation response protein AidB-like acyl-CoA dehydrogenase
MDAPLRKLPTFFSAKCGRDPTVVDVDYDSFAEVSMNHAIVDRSLLPGAEEREMLRDSVRGFLESHGPVEGAVERAAQPAAVAVVWQGLVGQGLAGLGAEPTEGGLREIAIVMEELGRSSCPVPMLAAALANLAFGTSSGQQNGGPTAAAFLNRLHGGGMRLGIAWASLDPDPQAGSLTLADGKARGTLRFVHDGAVATHLLVGMDQPAGLALIACSQPGVEVLPSTALGAAGWAEVHLNAAGVDFIALGRPKLDDLRLVARVALLARAHGSARRAFELVVEYAKERQQFGQPIGRFQAIQHKLANCINALEGVRLTLQHAAANFDFGLAEWRFFASAAVAFGAQSLREVSLETHHAFGAIGYAEEHEAPRHFRQVHCDSIVLGGAALARQELAAHLLDNEGMDLPEYDLGEAGNAFRTAVREWLEQHWSGERKASFDRKPFHDREYDPDFALDLGSTGWLGLGWPREFGGQSRTPREHLAFLEVMERAEAPRAGAAVQANALMMHGTPEQQARYLPEILRGEAIHGMGYSEPNAGSDLAALRTSAVHVRDEQGDGWVINGQKIWTTTWWGNYMFLAARTDREAKPQHAGISMFIVPMDTPGITIKSSLTMYDGSFATIFYDNVRVPADALVGKVNGGWKVLTDALANERGLVGGGIVLKVAHAFNLLCHDLRVDPARRADPLVRDRVGQLAAEIEVGRQLMIHCAELAESGTTPPELGAISKVFSGELMERFGEAALDLLGPRAALSQHAPGALRHGRYEQNLRHSLMWVISIGTNEIQRSLIAQRGLGLPR